MLQHLRFHRRAPSNPTSPIPENSPWDNTTNLQPTQLVPINGVPAPDIRPRSSSSVPFSHGHPPTSSQPNLSPNQQPPVLPPITRVVSAESDNSLDLGHVEQKTRDDSSKFLPRSPRSPYNDDSSFIGGLALRNYRKEQFARKPVASERSTLHSPESQNQKADISLSPPSHPPPPPPPPKASRTVSSFVSPTELQNAPTTGKRPPGAGMLSEPQRLSALVAPHEPPRGRKGLPFLKNPMSTLLLRRKTNQNVPDLSLPIKGPPVPFNDPRIRGTRVHDFSAPRAKKTTSSGDPASGDSEKDGDDRISFVLRQPSPVAEAPPVPPKEEHVMSIQSSSSTGSHRLSTNVAPVRISPGSDDGVHHDNSQKDSNQQRKNSTSISTSSLSRNVSQASSQDLLSSLPKHMKSTSSRFSFDMIGAAKQEKLLEERHRQRQLDLQADEPPEQRDSRFDDFDEDAFEYDNMDFDDGLEERIPGVNADYEAEDDLDALDDPDNDQENFAGFDFQRSDPTSALASPYSAGILPTPRDAYGHIIGYARTGDTPDLENHSRSSPQDLGQISPRKLQGEDTPAGLGIQGMGSNATVSDAISDQEGTHHEQTPTTLNKDDELYFRDRMHDFEGEGDGSTFDESLFDLPDTDKYGRPIPGLFAKVLSERNATEVTKKRESELTSRMSAHSDVTQSTDHTSLSADMQPEASETEADTGNRKPVEEAQQQEEDLSLEGQEDMAVYQAALAAAAYQAVASGKFRRDSDPAIPTELTVTSPTTSGGSQDHSHPDATDNYGFEDADGLSGGLDDYELDDDAIIAEANASALAHDSDGWYGQEFGFYSAPLPQPNHHSSNPPGDKNIFHYSNGGYFGPNGVNRTISGRVVSREPNLTPITERSEYSNRNSLMSPGMLSGGNNPLSSPGLAQLAMMAEDEHMTLSALLRLRSRAWGSSQVSLSSSREGSPHDRNGASSPWSPEIGGVGPSHGRKNSAFSIYSQESAGAQSGSGSPTLTMAMPSIPNNAIPPLNVPASSNSHPTTSPSSTQVFSPLQPAATFPPVIEDEELSSPIPSTNPPSKPFGENMIPIVGKPSQSRASVGGHRHKGSQDSISYTLEEESGETRWILERRRTAESGEIEILGREVVGNGRI